MTARSRLRWDTLTEELERLEHDNPIVATASRKYDEMRDRITGAPLTDRERIASAVMWLHRGLRRLAGINPFPTERSN